MPAYLIIRDFPIGLSVPYILASDGVFFFLLAEPDLLLGTNSTGRHHDHCLPCLRMAFLMDDARTEIVFPT